jgi:hypothetical protein
MTADEFVAKIAQAAPSVEELMTEGLYNAAKLGLVRGVLLRLRGQKGGVKLWDIKSIARWIQGELAKQ